MADIYICSFVNDLVNSASYARVEERSLSLGRWQRAMTFNQTTPHKSTPSPGPWFLGYSALIPFVLFTLLLCVAATVSSHEFFFIIIVTVLHLCRARLQVAYLRRRSG